MPRRLRARRISKRMPLSELLHASIPYDQYLCQAQNAYSKRDREEFIDNMREVKDHVAEIERITGIDFLAAMRRFGSAIRAAREDNWSDAISSLWTGDAKFWELIDKSDIEVELK